MRSAERSWVSLVVVLSSSTWLTLGSCSGGGTGPAEPDLVRGEALQKYSFTSVEAWRRDASAVVQVRITDERELSDPGLIPVEDRDTAPGPAGDGALLPRLVAVSVEEVLWAAAEETVPGDIELETWGWRRNGEEEQPFGVTAGPRVEVGQRYVAAIRRPESVGDRYSFLSDDSIFVLAGDGLLSAEGHDRQGDASGSDDQLSAGEAAVVGLTPDELRSLLVAPGGPQG